MKMLYRQLLPFMLWATLAATGSAQTLVQDPTGFQVNVPSQYQVKQDTSGAVCSDGSNILVVKSHGYANFEAFASQANLARDGFTQVGEVRVLNNTDRHFRASKPNPQGGYLIADTFVRFSPNGGGCLVVALSSPESSEAAYYAGQELANIVQFTDSNTGGIWAQALRGKHLVYLYTGNGYSERFDIYLLNNGTFIARSDMSSLSINGSGAAAGGGDGSWRVAGDQLVLQHNNGNQQVYQLAQRQASNEVSLNGKRYFVMND